MNFFYNQLQIAIGYLKRILSNQKKILKGQDDIKAMLTVIRTTQVQQGKQLTTILEEVTPPQPGVAVKLEFVFGDLASEQ